MVGRRTRALRWGVWSAVAVCQGVLLLWPAAQAAAVAVTMTTATAAGALAYGVAAARATGRDRRVWLLGAVALACWAGVEAALFLPTVEAGEKAARTPLADVCNLLAIGLAIVAMLTVPSAPTALVGRLRMLLDGLVVASSTLGTVWLLIISALVDRSHSLGDAIVEIAYPILAVGALVVALLVLAGQPRWRGSALTYMSGGLAALAVTLLVELFGVAVGADWLQAWVFGGLLAAAVLLALAPTQPLPPGADRPWEAGTAAGRLLPYVPVVGYFGLACAVLVGGGRLPVPAAMTGLVMICGVLARQFLTLNVNAELTRTLEGQRAALAHEAYHDRLTGLPNRARLTDRIAELDAGPAAGAAPALLMIDLDGFKEVNDTLGHAAGDELLVVVGERLRAATGAPQFHDAVAVRLGGDEFAVLLPSGGREAAVRLADAVLAAIAAPVPVAGRLVAVAASIGIAVHTDTDARARGLLRLADLALYQAKADGKHRYREYDEDMNTRAAQRRQLEADLARAVAGELLELAYQPIVDLATDRMLGVEALVRWRHPERGLLPPGVFLPTAEAMGLLPAIDRWVLRQACAQAQAWHAVRPDLTVSVNVSAPYLATGRLPDDVAAALAAAGLPPSALTVEVVESTLVTDLAGAARALAAVRRLGVHVAVDDFGVGYSSLAYLQHLPVDTIKMDRSFVRDLVHPDTPVVDVILALGRRLGLRVIAEGIETPTQAALLRGKNCPLAQGYLFARPMPAQELGALLTAPADVPA